MMLFPADASTDAKRRSSTQATLSVQLLDQAAALADDITPRTPHAETITPTRPTRPRGSPPSASEGETSEDDYSPAFDDGVLASPSARDEAGNDLPHTSSLRRILQISWPCLCVFPSISQSFYGVSTIFSLIPGSKGPSRGSDGIFVSLFSKTGSIG